MENVGPILPNTALSCLRSDGHRRASVRQPLAPVLVFGRRQVREVALDARGKIVRIRDRLHDPQRSLALRALAGGDARQCRRGSQAQLPAAAIRLRRRPQPRARAGRCTASSRDRS